MPPKEFGACKAGDQFAQFLPNLPAMYEVIRLPPELDFCELAIVPTVAHDPMLRSPCARQVIRLGCACDGRKSRGDVSLGATTEELVDLRGCGTEERLGEADNVEDSGAFHAVTNSVRG